MAGLCDGMIEAWEAIGDTNAAILFVIENVTYNICDQVSNYMIVYSMQNVIIFDLFAAIP